MPAPGRIASPDLSGAVRTVRLDERAAGAPALGIAAIGEGLQKLGPEMIRLQEKAQQGADLHGESLIKTAFENKKAEMTAALAQEPDLDKHQQIAADYMSQFDAESTKVSLSPAIRQRVDDVMMLQKAQVMGNVMENTATTKVRQGAAAILGTMQNAAARNDRATYMQARKGAAAYGIGEHVLEAEDLNFQKQAQIIQTNEQKTSILNAVRQDPDQTLEMLKSDKLNVPPDVREWGTNRAQEAIRERAAANTQAMMDEAAKGPAGQLSVPDDVDAWAKDRPGFTDRMKKAAKDYIRRTTEAANKVYIAQNAPRFASQIDSDISSMNPDTMTPDQYFGARAQIAALPTTYHKLLYDQLDARYFKTPLPESRDILSAGAAQTRSMLESGMLGMWEKRTPILNNEREPVLDSQGHPKYEITKDEEAFARARWVRSEMDRKFREWVALHPKEAQDQTRAMEFINTLVPPATRAQAADQMARMLNEPVRQEPPANMLAPDPNPQAETPRRERMPTRAEALRPPLPDTDLPASDEWDPDEPNPLLDLGE